MTPKVYILRESFVGRGEFQRVQDYTPAMKYGEVVFVTTAEPSPVPASRSNETLHEELTKFVKDYRPDRDWIVPTGAPSMILLAGMYLSRLHGRVRMLMWKTDMRDYVPFEWKF